METLEKSVKYVVIDIVLVSLLLVLNIFYTFFSVSIVDLEQVNVYWARKLSKLLFKEYLWTLIMELEKTQFSMNISFLGLVYNWLVIMT